MRTESGSSSPLRCIEERLVVERLDLRRPAGHEEVDDALRARGEMERAAEHAAVGRRGAGLRGDPGQTRRAVLQPGGPSRVHEIRQRHPAEAHPELRQHAPPREAGGWQGPDAAVTALVVHRRFRSAPNVPDTRLHGRHASVLAVVWIVSLGAVHSAGAQPASLNLSRDRWLRATRWPYV